VTASLILRKLGSYPRQNGLAVALRELGRIERTLFILDWLQSVELRRRVHAGLNKGEARNALARAVLFNRLGEIRDRCDHSNQLNVLCNPFSETTRNCPTLAPTSMMVPK
jgi:TnpA family transposase